MVIKSFLAKHDLEAMRLGWLAVRIIAQCFSITYKDLMGMKKLLEMIEAEIDKRSLLKHPFYQKWSKGELTLDHLQGYSKEYSKLVKSIPNMVGNIAVRAKDQQSFDSIKQSEREEYEHIEPWCNFAVKLGVPKATLDTYEGTVQTNRAVSKLQGISEKSIEEGISSMYAYEMELPRISRTKLDGLEEFYNLTDADATEYFRIHETVDVRHAQMWRDLIEKIPLSKYKIALDAAVDSLKAQNELLDSVYENYVVKK
jgi:pyrroloquinoline-quinone synthase